MHFLCNMLGQATKHKLDVIAAGQHGVTTL